MPKYFRRLVIGLSAVALMASCCVCQADWTGNLTIKLANLDSPNSKATFTCKGSVSTRGEQQRMEMAIGPKHMVSIMDFSNGTAWALSPKFHVAFRADDKNPITGSDNCNPLHVDACYKNAKKVGTAVVDGHPCTIYEEKYKGTTSKNWRPNDLKDVFAVKSTVSKGGREIADFEISAIKVGPQPESLFSVPKDYKIMNPRAFKSYTAASNSMLPVLRKGEEFLVDTSAYQRFSPERGDAVAWQRPGSKEVRVGRIVALPRERVAYHDGILSITGRDVHTERLSDEKCRGLIGEANVIGDEFFKDVGCFEENLEGFKHVILAPAFPSTEKNPPVEIWVGSYYVIPDDRRAYDIPIEACRIKKKQIVGKVLLPQE